jgi:hypothetical protein
VTAQVALFIGNYIERFPALNFIRQQVIFKAFVSEAPDATICVDVANFSQSRIQTLEHTVNVAENDGFGIAESGHSIGQTVFDFFTYTTHHDSK